MKALETHNLRKEFVRKDGRKRVRVAALRGITFDLARGECIAILGQNGSGKSTLVRLLSTLLIPDGGSATIFGHDISETRAVRRMVNRVSGDPASQLHERHDAGDFDTKTQDKIEEPAKAE